MITEVHIVNFRGLVDFKLPELGRVNLLTGANGTGKTSILEALSLAYASALPMPYLRQAELRGIGFESPAALEGAVRWLFNRRETGSPVEVVIRDGVNGRLQFTLSESDGMVGMTDDLFNQGKSKGTGRSAALSRASSGVPSPIFTTVLSVDGNERTRGQIRIGHDKPEWRTDTSAQSLSPFPVCYIHPNLPQADENPERWSTLVRLNRTEQLLDCLRTIEPRLRGIQILASGGKQGLEAQLSGLGFVPVGLLGGGFTKVLNLLLAVLAVDSRLVLVDEVESGLHPDRFSDLWKAIIHAASLLDVQMIATTHSHETCVAALMAADGLESESNVPDAEFPLLRQYRLARDELDGRIVAIAQSQEQLATTFQLGLDVR